MIKDVFFIQEGCEATELTPLSEDEKFSLNIPILEEQRREGRKGGTVFRTILQEANVLNKNKRTYRYEAIDGALKEEAPRIDGGTFFCELDHPLESDPARFTRVEIKNSCCRILKTEWDGNVLYGIGETLASTPGKDMQALIVENGIKLGFSLRAMGKTEMNPKTGLIEVVSPMRMFCYDCVSNPSHANAKMTNILSENELMQIVSSNSQKELLMENENNLKAIVESYGYNFEDLLNTEKVAVMPDSGLALVRLEESTIKAFIEKDSLNAFLRVKKSYFNI